MTKLSVYIDGFNLYHAIDALGDVSLKWINYRLLAHSFLKPHETISRVAYFTAVMTWEKDKQVRHRNFIKAQLASGVEVIESNFRRMTRHCRVMDRYCARYEEKKTDVAFALSVFSDAMTGGFDRAVLITADSDQVPLANAVRAHFPDKTLTLAAPPERGGGARELGAAVHDRVPITVGRLKGCKLPRDVRDGRGKVVATRPAAYAV